MDQERPQNHASPRQGSGVPRPVRDSIAAAVIVLIAGIAAVILGLVETRRLLEEGMATKLGHLAASIASQVDGDLHSRLTRAEQTDSPEYERCIASMRRAHAVLPQLKFVYTLVKDDETFRFVLDTSKPGDADGDNVEDRSSVWDEYAEISPELATLVRTPPQGGTAVTTPISDRWGTWISGYAPIRDAQGAIVALLGIDMDASGYVERIGRADRTAVAGLAPCVLVSIVVGGIVFALRRRELHTMAELRSATVMAENASRAKSAFLANMSHEIRTPLTAILGYADILRDPTLSQPERLQHVGTIHRAGSHLLEVINDILDVSRIEAEKMTLETTTFTPADIVDDVRQFLAGRAAEKSVALHCQWNGPTELRTLGDPLRLRQILVNLVGNAIKFTSEGDVTLSAGVDTESPASPGNARLRFTITDTGIGMNPQQIGRLFQAFSQVDNSTTRKFGGSGLGLIISKRLAQMMGGDITVTSEPNVGSRFTVTICLPLAAPPPPADSAPGSPAPASTDRRLPEPSDQPDPLPSARILLAEDTPDNQRLIRVYLNGRCAELVIVGDGQAAVEAVLRRQAAPHAPESAAATPAQFDVVLMDMQMPVMDGYRATAALRAAGFTGPIIAFTAHAMTGDREACLASGCDDHLSKPVSRPELLEHLRQMLSTRNRQQLATRLRP